ncbi:MAG: DUF2950 family protein [Planctomycetes bacterium]|nr:DUF2950 family protein [Planctomycetota bacterium]
MWRIPYGPALLAIWGQPVLTLAVSISEGGGCICRWAPAWNLAALLLIIPPVALGTLFSPPRPPRWAPAWRSFCLAFLALNFAHLAWVNAACEKARWYPFNGELVADFRDALMLFSPTGFGVLSACWSIRQYDRGGEATARRGFSLSTLLLLIGFACLWFPLAMGAPMGCRRHPANETSAVAALKQVVSTQSTWRQTDSDGNGIQDYWTLDVAGFYGMRDASGATLNFIDVNFAKADGRPRVTFNGQSPTPVAKSGYLFYAMKWDETGAAYNVNYVPTQRNATFPQGRPACNPYKFGFCAVPAVYGQTGIRTFIVSEEGVLYGVDSECNAPVLRWPGVDPTACTVKGRYWRVVQ